MSLYAAFISVVLIWSTTPLAIQWSSEGWGFLFGVSGRMVIGALVCLLLVLVLRHKIVWTKPALQTYVAASLGIYAAMLSVYWGAQYIPSGLIAVLYGLSPIITAVLAALWLQENSLTLGKVAGALLGVVGLVVIFQSNIGGAPIAWQGIVGVLLSVVFHATSAILIKRIHARLPALTTTSGALFMVTPVYIITWLLVDGGEVPHEIPLRAGASMVYLGVLATVVGFSLYYYVLSKVEANRVALLTLITPVLALLVGQWFNDEQISLNVWLGTLCILTALTLHQWGDELFKYAYLRVLVLKNGK
ncbi:MAG: DMT family transporter [Gammaproteobacteria bacterium]|nr:DMT family transporter [Gammaproteobacteria bacterium]